MGTVWLKTKDDKGMNMLIPHSPNFANAMYGYINLGAEIIAYDAIDDIYDNVTKDDIVLDYIDQCNTIFKKFGVEPYVPDYPEELSKYLGRKIWHDTIYSISCNEKKWSSGCFVKPVKDKVFTGHIVTNIGDLVGCGSCYEDYEVLVSEPIAIQAEWRCFIYYDEILDIRPYGLLLGRDRKSYLYHYDSAVVCDMMDDFRKWQDRPMACSMDICYTKDGRTLLVEMNDAYALGCYGLEKTMYARFVSARWSQLLQRVDEYRL